MIDLRAWIAELRNPLDVYKHPNGEEGGVHCIEEN